MDKRLTAPYKPHSSLVISDKEILEMEQYNIPVSLEIQKMRKKAPKNNLSKI